MMNLMSGVSSGFTNFLYILLAIFIFGILILVHELGHYIAARCFKVTIKEFSIGLGPKLVSYVSKKTNIRYSLRLLPLGGYVSMAGADENDDDPNAFNKKKPWKPDADLKNSWNRLYQTYIEYLEPNRKYWWSSWSSDKHLWSPQSRKDYKMTGIFMMKKLKLFSALYSFTKYLQLKITNSIKIQ